MEFKFSTKDIVFSVVVILAIFFQDAGIKFIVGNFINKDFFTSLPEEYRLLIIQVIGWVFCLIVLFFLAQFSLTKAREMLGFDKGFTVPAVYATFSCLPMLMGYAIVHGLQPGITFKTIFLYSIWPGFSEEIIFRLFLMGILVRYANWNFILAALLSALLFAKNDLCQAHNFIEGCKILIAVSGAGLGFAVLCRMWNWNVWFTVLMHVLMNLSVVLFIPHNSVLLNTTDPLFRGTTIFFAIVVTIFYRIMSFKKNADSGS